MHQFNRESSMSAPKIQAWLVERIAKQLQLHPDEIDPSVPLDSYGIDSAQALFLMGEAQDFWGLELSPMLLWHYPTIESLSQRLAEEFADSESEVIEI